MSNPSAPSAIAEQPRSHAGHPAQRKIGLRRWLWLFLVVQCDALRSAPAAYFDAVWWRLIGKRVRSRNRIAALTGHSPRAYRLWMARREPTVWPRLLGGDTSGFPPICVVIDCRFNPELAAATLASIQPASQRHFIFPLGGPTAQKLADTSAPGALMLDWCSGLVELGRVLAARGGGWVCPLMAGDRLAAEALSVYGQAAAQAGAAALIYADDDLLDHNGKRHAPHFKPDWNAELFRFHDYLSSSAIIRLDPAALSAPDFARSGDWVCTLVGAAVSHAAAPPIHVPAVLHHRTHRPTPPRARALAPIATDTLPSVTIIIPTRNQRDLLRRCVEGVARTRYRHRDVIIIDNDSDDPLTIAYLAQLVGKGVAVMPCPGPFNYAAMNNAAAERATGEYLCFLNNDIEMLGDGWLAALIQQAIRPDVGAAGAKLLYPDHTLQHAGVVLGIGDAAAHAHRGLPDSEPGYFGRPHLPQFVSAVTGACLVVAKPKFAAAGGFDEAAFAVAFNDVDLCLKLNALGWQTLYEPRAMLIHHESQSRGDDLSGEKRLRFAGELAELKRRWHTDRLIDPFHHPELSRFSEQFVVKV